jgi:hypothetical protein
VPPKTCMLADGFEVLLNVLEKRKESTERVRVGSCSVCVWGGGERSLIAVGVGVGWGGGVDPPPTWRMVVGAESIISNYPR